MPFLVSLCYLTFFGVLGRIVFLQTMQNPSLCYVCIETVGGIIDRSIGYISTISSGYKSFLGGDFLLFLNVHHMWVDIDHQQTFLLFLCIDQLPLSLRVRIIPCFPLPSYCSFESINYLYLCGRGYSHAFPYLFPRWFFWV
jgi:hypothetical protein